MTFRTSTLWIALLAAVAGATTAGAATPPDRLNYQGVLRDAADAPLDGDFDMIFRFWSAETAGDEILLDRHLAANAQAVTVSGGLFGAAVGAGDVVDGSGPGTYATLAEVFRDHGDVWLEVQVAGETLAPRLAVAAAGYALNSAHLDGQPAGHFLDTSSTVQTKTGNLVVNATSAFGYGIKVTSSYGGAEFRDTDESGQAFVAVGDTGIAGYGDSAGGYFADNGGSGRAYVGTDDFGIRGLGNSAGGNFEDTDGSGLAWVGYGDYGIEARGDEAGGYFKDASSSGFAFVGRDGYGIQARGNDMGGYFEDLNGSGFAYLGNGDYGVRGYGNTAGGYFQDRNSDGWVYLGLAAYGLHAYGATGGAYFEDTNSGTQTRTAYGSASTQGTGAKNFVQNHPHDPSRKIVYAALEGNEVGTYVRGSARLEDGVARVALDETFAWVTNPDVGLTAQVTSRSPNGAVYVESVATDELVVRAVDGFDGEAAFDYLVSGLRIGFEDVPTVQPKDAGEDLPIPSMATHRAMLARQPELKTFTPLGRFRAIEARVFPGRHGAGLDLSRSRALVAAIREFDPATDTVARPEPLETADVRPAEIAAEASPAAASRSEATTESSSAPEPSDAAVAGPGLPPGAILLPASGAVDVGDLLVLDPERPGALRVATTIADPNVVGVAVSAPSDMGEVAVAGSGFATVKADAGYGAIRAGDLLTGSATAGHTMLAIAPEPGTIVGKALEPLDVGTGTIRILLLAR